MTLTDKFKLPNGDEIDFFKLDPNQLREFFGEQSSKIFRASIGLLRDLKKENPEGDYRIEFLRKSGNEYLFRAADFSTDKHGLIVTTASVRIEREVEVSYEPSLPF